MTTMNDSGGPVGKALAAVLMALMVTGGAFAQELDPATKWATIAFN